MRRGRIGRIAALLLLLLLVLGSVSLADRHEVTSSVSPRQGIRETDEVRFVITVRGTATPRVSTPRLGVLTNLSVLSGPHVERKTSWINGQVSASLEFTWVLLPERAGPAEIPAIEIEVASTTQRTAAHRFTVASGSHDRDVPDIPGKPASSPVESVFVRAELGVQEAWVGQPIPLNVTLYTLPRLAGFDFPSEPEYKDFWVESFQVDPQREVHAARIGGRRYTAWPIERKALIPTAPGEFEIEPFVVKVDIMEREWIFGRTKSVYSKTSPLKVKVRALPLAGQPPGFDGAVGSFRIRSELDRTEARVDDAVSLKVTVEGQGALRSVGPPLIDLPADVQVHEPAVKESRVAPVEGRIRSRKQWEWILVPRAPGRFELPPVRFDYFDPSTKRYREATAPPLRIAVERGGGADGERLARSAIQVQRRDIHFIKLMRGMLATGQPRAHRSSLFRTLIVLPLALVPALILVGRQRARMENNRGLARGRRARSRAKKKLRTTRRRLEQADSAAFHEDVGRALVDYVSDRADRAAAGLTYDAADELLAARGIEAELRSRFRACLERCDFARFVPAAAEAGRRTELIDEASILIDELDRAW